MDNNIPDEFFEAERTSPNQLPDLRTPTGIVLVETTPQIQPFDKQQLVRKQWEDDSLKQCHQHAKDNVLGYFYQDEVLIVAYKDLLGLEVSKVVLPTSRRLAVMRAAYSSPAAPYSGVKKTKALSWPSMSRDMAQFCRGCTAYQLASQNDVKGAPLQPLPCITKPFSAVVMDLVGSLPLTARWNRYILIAMCLYSKYPEAIPLRKVNNTAVVEALLEVISRHGIPDVLLTDEGTMFVSTMTKKLHESLEVAQIKTSQWHHQSDVALKKWVLQRNAENVLFSCY